MLGQALVAKVITSRGQDLLVKMPDMVLASNSNVRPVARAVEG